MAPQTGYELTGEWTSLEDELSFLNTVASETDVTMSVIGQSVQGKEIRQVSLGGGPENTMLIVSLIHGNEQASREGALMQIRDLAYSEDPSIVTYLSNHRIVWIPTASPDTFPNRRNNINGVNPNRDFYKLTQPETQAVVEAIKDNHPHLIVDAHEYFSSGDDWWGFPGGMVNAHPDIKKLEQSIYDSGVDTMTSNGYTSNYYGVGGIPRAGLSVTASSHHAVGILSETNALHGEPAVRVSVQKIILDMVRDWHESHADECTQAQRASIEWANESEDPDLLHIRTEFVGRDVIEEVSLAGYQLEGTLPQLYIDAFGIEVDESGFVPMNQTSRHFIPQVLDPEAMDRRATAHRVIRPPKGEGKGKGVMRVGDRLHGILGMKFRAGDDLFDVSGSKFRSNGDLW